jgi:hypothetical protein
MKEKISRKSAPERVRMASDAGQPRKRPAASEAELDLIEWIRKFNARRDFLNVAFLSSGRFLSKSRGSNRMTVAQNKMTPLCKPLNKFGVFHQKVEKISEMTVGKRQGIDAERLLFKMLTQMVFQILLLHMIEMMINVGMQMNIHTLTVTIQEGQIGVTDRDIGQTVKKILMTLRTIVLECHNMLKQCTKALIVMLQEKYTGIIIPNLIDSRMQSSYMVE